MRGPDWDWGNQDGGTQSVGLVLDVRGWETESFRSVACVKWKPTSTNVYRVGHKGKVGKFQYCEPKRTLMLNTSSIDEFGSWCLESR